MEQKIFDLFYRYSEQEVNLNTHIEDLGIDSMDIVDLSFDIEKEFDIKLSNKEVIQNFDGKNTVSDIVELVKSKLLDFG